MAADFSSRFGSYVLFLLLAVLEVHAGEHCYTYSYMPMYCRYGCCGTGLDKYCCTISVGVIIGGVIGAIACICVIITIICCCIKKTTYQGRVVAHHSVPAGNVTVVHSNMTPMGYSHVGGPQPMSGFAAPPPPMYGQPPPPYAYSNPAYPPGLRPGGVNTGFAAPAAPAYPPNACGP